MGKQCSQRGGDKKRDAYTLTRGKNINGETTSEAVIYRSIHEGKCDGVEGNCHNDKPQEMDNVK